MNEVSNTHLTLFDFNSEPGRVEFKYQESQSKEALNVWFEMDSKCRPSNDAIAYALSTMIPQKADTVVFDNLPISHEAIVNIKEFRGVEVQANVDTSKASSKPSKFSPSGFLNTLRKECNHPNYLLSFSGGFDSLAAYCLMPEKTTKLVAIDFGGWFVREEEYFRKFKPYTLKTNFRQLKLDRAHWTFMGVGAILYSDFIGADYHAFGSILEASPTNMKRQRALAGPIAAPEPLSFLGLKEARPTTGLTEVGTAILVSKYLPEEIQESLTSLSGPETEKRYRKEALVNIVASRFNRQISFEPTLPPKNKIPFGENIAIDFLCLYILKYGGYEIAANTVSDIPEEAIRLADKLDLHFYEKFNATLGPNLGNAQDQSYCYSRLLQAGIEPYSEHDFREYRKVIDYLISIR